MISSQTKWQILTLILNNTVLFYFEYWIKRIFIFLLTITKDAQMNKVNPAVVSIRHLTCRIFNLDQERQDIGLATEFMLKDNQILPLTK